MSSPVIFNRRLGKNEIDLLFDLIESTSRKKINRIQSSKFFQLDDAIAFMSSIEDKAIGGSIVYRDRTRLGMVLAGLAISDEYRDVGLYTVVKSSLPFFKTVAIRDVDALVVERDKDDTLGFPHSFCLPSWSKSVLGRIGFVEEQKLFSCNLKMKDGNIPDYDKVSWDQEANLEGARSLIWDEGKVLGMTNSIIWMSLDIAHQFNNLYTLTQENTTKLAFSYDFHEPILIISFITMRSDSCSSTTAQRILASIIKETNATEVQFPLVGVGQVNLLENLADEIGGTLMKQSITLMRRKL